MTEEQMPHQASGPGGVYSCSCRIGKDHGPQGWLVSVAEVATLLEVPEDVVARWTTNGVIRTAFQLPDELGGVFVPRQEVDRLQDMIVNARVRANMRMGLTAELAMAHDLLRDLVIMVEYGRAPSPELLTRVWAAIRLPELPEWAKYLPAADQALMQKELQDTPQADHGQLLVEWQHTAEALMDPDAREVLLHPGYPEATEEPERDRVAEAVELLRAVQRDNGVDWAAQRAARVPLVQLPPISSSVPMKWVAVDLEYGQVWADNPFPGGEGSTWGAVRDD